MDGRLLSVEPISPSKEPVIGGGLHLFKVEFERRDGRCFITTGEALHLRQLNIEWVEQALLNIAVRDGWDRLEAVACSEPGLMLHCSDASEPWERRPRRSSPPATPFESGWR